MAQKYYNGKNDAVLKRLTYLQKNGVHDSKVIFHKLCSGFFPKFIKQESQYLLGNGVTVSYEAKKALGGDKFDNLLQKTGLQSLVDGVNWGFWNVDHLVVFRATEFLPLYDEMTGSVRAGIRFWQISSEKPFYVEVFEEDGFTRYKSTSGLEGFLIEEKKRSYKEIIHRDVISYEVVGAENYCRLPIFPFYANDLKQSELTNGIKSMIDAYDFISSDLVDGITLIEGVYWVIKNYGGDEVADLIKELETLKATYTDDDSNAESSIIELPYQAKETALKLLSKQLYTDFMALNMSELTGGSLTNVAINVAKTDFDLKVDLFEWQALDFVNNILSLIGYENEEIQFKRRTITNDTETVQNIYTMRADLDHETALDLNPLIPDQMVDDILRRFAAEQLGLEDGEELENLEVQDETLEV